MKLGERLMNKYTVFFMLRGKLEHVVIQAHTVADAKKTLLEQAPSARVSFVRTVSNTIEREEA